jgi:hypothetical protein
MKDHSHLRSIDDEVGVFTPTIATRVVVLRVSSANLSNREFLAANGRASTATRRSELGAVVVPAPRLLTSHPRPRYFPL